MACDVVLVRDILNFLIADPSGKKKIKKLENNITPSIRLYAGRWCPRWYQTHHLLQLFLWNKRKKNIVPTYIYSLQKMKKELRRLDSNS